MKLSACMYNTWQCHVVCCYSYVELIYHVDILKYMNANTNIVAIVNIDNSMHVCIPAITVLVLHVLWTLGLSCRHLAAYMTPARVHPKIRFWVEGCAAVSPTMYHAPIKFCLWVTLRYYIVFNLCDNFSEYLHYNWSTKHYPYTLRHTGRNKFEVDAFSEHSNFVSYQ